MAAILMLWDNPLSMTATGISLREFMTIRPPMFILTGSLTARIRPPAGWVVIRRAAWLSAALVTTYPAVCLRGNVAQVAVFTNALTGSQVQTLYYAGELAPSITQQPQNLTIGLGSTGSLTVGANGNPTLLYQWYQGTTKLSDVAGSLSGTATATLTFTNAQLLRAGNYTVVVTNNYGSITSMIAVVAVTPRRTSPANQRPTPWFMLATR